MKGSLAQATPAQYFAFLMLALMLAAAAFPPIARADDPSVVGPPASASNGNYQNISGTFTSPNSGGVTQVSTAAQDLRYYIMIANLGAFGPSSCASVPGLNGQPTCLLDVQKGLGDYLNKLFQMGIAISTGLALFMITFGGVKYVSSDAIGGKSEGKEMIMNALKGLLLAFASVILLKQINPDLVVNNLDVMNQNATVNSYESTQGLAAVSGGGPAGSAGNWGGGSTAITASVNSQVNYLTSDINDAQKQLADNQIENALQPSDITGLENKIANDQQQILQLNTYLAQNAGGSSGTSAGFSSADFKLSTNTDGSITAVPGHVAIDFDGPSKTVSYTYTDPTTGQPVTTTSVVKDPSWQPQTSSGLDGSKDSFVVTPLNSNIPKGWVADVTNTTTGQTVNNVPIGDRGPSSNGYGEISAQLGQQLHVWTPANGNSVAGTPVLTYTYHPPR